MQRNWKIRLGDRVLMPRFQCPCWPYEGLLLNDGSEVLAGSCCGWSWCLVVDERWRKRGAGESKAQWLV